MQWLQWRGEERDSESLYNQKPFCSGWLGSRIIFCPKKRKFLFLVIPPTLKIPNSLWLQDNPTLCVLYLVSVCKQPNRLLLSSLSFLPPSFLPSSNPSYFPLSLPFFVKFLNFLIDINCCISVWELQKIITSPPPQTFLPVLPQQSSPYPFNPLSKSVLQRWIEFR